MKPALPRGAISPLALPLLLAAVFVLPGSLQAKVTQEPTTTVRGTVSADGQLLPDGWRGGDRRVRTGRGGRLSATAPAALSLPQLAAAQDRRGISISFDSIRIRDEDDPISNDEPYLIATRFRMRIRVADLTASIVPGTLRVDNAMSGQNDLGRSGDNWADEDNTYQLPPGTPHIVQATFPWNEAGWVLGAVVVHMEEDGFSGSTANLLSTKVRDSVRAALSSTPLGSVDTNSITAAVARKILGDLLRSVWSIDIGGYVRALVSAADPDDFGGVNVVLTATGPRNTAFFFAGTPPSSPEGALAGVRPLIATANVTLPFPAGDLSRAPWTARFTGDHRVNGTIRAWRQGRGVGAISAGTVHTCALTNAGGVKCWGDNSDGQLGDGTQTGRLTPVDVRGLGSGVAAVSAGHYHTCALTSAGGVKCWGRNGAGELGDGTETDRLTPVGVSGLGSGAIAISAGYEHTCALTSAGGVKCWGRNGFGQLGDGTETDRLTPVDVSGLTGGVAAISTGSYHTCALTAAGGVKCWGLNNYGRLGDGTQGVDRLTPVDVSGLTGGVVAISADGSHTCALTDRGGVKCWGDNDYGQLGDGTQTGRLTPVGVRALGSGVVAISAGVDDTCALTEGAGVRRLLGGAGVKCWGHNGAGELGDGTTTNRLTPVGVSGLGSGAIAISAGYEHTCALTAAGGAKCWGDNGYGQLGDGTTTNRLIPVGVSGLPPG